MNEDLRIGRRRRGSVRWDVRLLACWGLLWATALHAQESQPPADGNGSTAANVSPSADAASVGGPANVASVEAEPAGILDIVFSGGWFGALMILTLVALSIATAYLVFDQFITLRRGEVVPEGLSESVRQALATGRVAEADAVCRNQPSVLSVVMLCGLAEADLGYPAVEKASEEALVQQSSRLMRKIDYLAVIGNLAPMVGLLGTVTGMVTAFAQVAATRGGAGAGELAEGIYQALVTTVGGLLVAIPALGAHAVCRNRVDALLAEATYQATQALAPLKRRLAGRTPRA